MKYSRADSRIKMWKFSDVSETVPIFRMLLTFVINLTTSNTLKMGTELVSETSENFHISIRLYAQEYFIEFCRREALNT